MRRSLTPGRSVASGRSLKPIQGPEGRVALPEKLENDEPVASVVPEERNYSRALRKIAGPKRIPPTVKVRTTGPEGYTAESRGYARLNGPKPMPRTSFVKQALESGRAKYKAFRGKPVPRSYTIRDEINVLGELVHFDDEAEAVYSVNFRETYFTPRQGETPGQEQYENALIHAKAVFSAYFSSAVPDQTPVKPCKEEDYAALVRGLETRFQTLRDTVQDAQQVSPESVEVREGVEHLLRIKAWLEGMQTNGACISFSTGALEGVAREKVDINDVELTNLLKNFAFLVLQSKENKEAYEPNQNGVDAEDVVSMVSKVSLPDPEAYAKEHATIPSSLRSILLGIQSPELGKVLIDDAALDTLLEAIEAGISGKTGSTIAKIQPLLRTVDSGVQRGGGHDEKVKTLSKIIEILLADLTTLEGKSKTLEGSLAERNAAFSAIESKLAAAQAELAAANAQREAQGKSVDQKDARIGELAGQLAATKAALEAAGVAQTDKEKAVKTATEETQAKIAALEAEKDATKAQIEAEQNAANQAKASLDSTRQIILGLNKQINKQIAQNKQLQLTLTEKAQEVLSLTQERERLRQQLSGANGAAQNFAAERQALNRQYEDAVADKETALRQQLQQLTGEHAAAISEKSREVETIAAERAKVAAEKEAVAKQVEELQTLKTQVELAKGELQTKLTRAEKAKESVIEQARTHKSQLDEITQSRDALTAKLAEVGDVEQKLKEAIAAKEAAGQESEELQRNLAIANASAQDLREDLDKAKAATAALTAKVTAAEQAKTAAEAQITKLEDANRRLDAEKEKAEKDIAELTKQLSDAQEREVSLRDKVTGLEGERTALLAKVEKVQEDKQKAIDGLRAAKARELAEQKTALEAEHAKAQAELQGKMDAAMAAAAAEKAELENQIQQKDIEIQKEKKAYEALNTIYESALEAHKEEIQQKDTILRKLEQDNSALQDQLSKGKEEISRMREDILSKGLRIQQLQAAVATAEERIAAAGEEITGLKAERDGLTAELSAEKASVERLQSDIAAKELTNQELTKTLEANKAAHDQLRQELSSAQTAAAAAAAEFTKGREEFEAKLAEATAETKEKEDALNEKLAEVARLEERSAGQATALAEKETTLDGMRESLREAKREVATARQRIETAEAASASVVAEATAAQDGLFETVIKLADKIQTGEDAEDIFSVNARFRAIYSRMLELKGQSKKAAPSAPAPDAKQRSCYLNYFISFFLRQFFFTGTALPEKQRIYGTVRRMVDEFLGKNTELNLSNVLTDAFNLLRAAEDGGASGTRFGFPVAFQTYIAERADTASLTQALKGYFAEGFPAFQALATREPVAGVAYELLMAFYTVAAQKYLNQQRAELAAYCPVPQFLVKPVAVAPKRPKRLGPKIKQTADVLQAESIVPIETTEALPESSTEPTDKDYRRLGLVRGASAKEVRKAYLRLSLQKHPNKGGNAREFSLMKQSYERIMAALQGVPVAEVSPLAITNAAPVTPEPVAPEPVAPEPEPPSEAAPEPVSVAPTEENYQRLGIKPGSTSNIVKRAYKERLKPKDKMRPKGDPEYDAKLKASYDRVLGERHSLHAAKTVKEPTAYNLKLAELAARRAARKSGTTQKVNSRTEPTSTTRKQLRASWNAMAAAEAAAEAAKKPNLAL